MISSPFHQQPAAGRSHYSEPPKPNPMQVFDDDELDVVDGRSANRSLYERAPTADVGPPSYRQTSVYNAYASTPHHDQSMHMPVIGAQRAQSRGSEHRNALYSERSDRDTSTTGEEVF